MPWRWARPCPWPRLPRQGRRRDCGAGRRGRVAAHGIPAAVNDGRGDGGGRGRVCRGVRGLLDVDRSSAVSFIGHVGDGRGAAGSTADLGDLAMGRVPAIAVAAAGASRHLLVARRSGGMGRVSAPQHGARVGGDHVPVAAAVSAVRQWLAVVVCPAAEDASLHRARDAAADAAGRRVAGRSRRGGGGARWRWPPALAAAAAAVPCIAYLDISSSERTRNTLAVLPALRAVAPEQLFTDYYGARVLRILEPQLPKVSVWYHARFDTNQIVVLGDLRSAADAYVLLIGRRRRSTPRLTRWRCRPRSPPPPADWQLVWRAALTRTAR